MTPADALPLPFTRTGDGTVSVDPHIDRQRLAKAVRTFRRLAVDPDDQSYGLLYPALSEDPLTALELDGDGDRSAMLTDPADTVLETVDDDVLDADTFDAWLKVFGNARRVLAARAQIDRNVADDAVVASIVYACLVATLPEPS